MKNEAMGGPSKRSLVLLGAFAALAMNPYLRRRMLTEVHKTWDQAQQVLDNTIWPNLQQASEQAGRTMQQMGENWEQLRHQTPERAQALFDQTLEHAQDAATQVADVAGQKAHSWQQEAQESVRGVQDNLAEKRKAYADRYGDRVSALAEDVRETAEEQQQEAQQAVQYAKVSGVALFSDLLNKANTFLGRTEGNLDHQYKQAEYHLLRTQRQLERDMRRQKPHWNAEKLEKVVQKKLVPFQKKAHQHLAHLEKQALKDGFLDRQNLRYYEPASTGLNLGASVAVVLGVGVIVLARVPAARQGLLNVVRMINPVAAEQLHSASKQARDLLGEYWLQSESVSESADEPESSEVPQATTNTHSPQSTGTKPTENSAEADQSHQNESKQIDAERSKAERDDSSILN